MTNLFDKYNLPMTVVIALIVWSWFILLSVILA
jgi:hypothetical protein